MEANARCNNLIEETKDGLKIKDVTQWKPAYDQICEEYGIQVVDKPEEFVFTVESWGQLDPKDMVKEAIKRLKKKSDDFSKLF